jgi:hypothetical protein
VAGDSLGFAAWGEATGMKVKGAGLGLREAWAGINS